MPDDGPRHFELENTLEDSDDCAKQPAQLAVLAPAAGSRRPTRRRPLGSISRDSLLWTAHELAAQRRADIGFDVRDGAITWLAVLLGFFFLLRSSKYLRKGLSPGDQKCLRVRKILFARAGSDVDCPFGVDCDGILVFQEFSKNDFLGEGLRMQ